MYVAIDPSSSVVLIRIAEKKLAKKKENEARLALKAAKAAAATPAGESKKAKKEKEVKEEEPEFVNTPPKGEKKGTPRAYLGGQNL